MTNFDAFNDVTRVWYLKEHPACINLCHPKDSLAVSLLGAGTIFTITVCKLSLMLQTTTTTTTTTV